MWKHYLVGVLTSFIVGFLFVSLAAGLLHSSSLFQWDVIFSFIPGGFLAGYVGSWLEKKFAKSSLHKIGLILLTIILSIILSGLSFGALRPLTLEL